MIPIVYDLFISFFQVICFKHAKYKVINGFHQMCVALFTNLVFGVSTELLFGHKNVLCLLFLPHSISYV